MEIYLAHAKSRGYYKSAKLYMATENFTTIYDIFAAFFSIFLHIFYTYILNLYTEFYCGYLDKIWSGYRDYLWL